MSLQAQGMSQCSWRQAKICLRFLQYLSPVVTWFNIKMVLVLLIFIGCINWQADFVIVLTHSYIEFDMYMEIHQGIEMKEVIRKMHILSLLKNVLDRDRN